MTRSLGRKPAFPGRTPAFGAFASLFQGDHASVEFGTAVHAGLLEQHSLLQTATRILPGRPLTSLAPYHDAVIIDDYFALSKEQDPPIESL